MRPVAHVAHLRGEANATLVGADLDDFLQPRKCSAHDEDDVGSIHLQEFLLRMLHALPGAEQNSRALDSATSSACCAALARRRG